MPRLWVLFRFRFRALGFRVSGLGFRVYKGLGFRTLGPSGFRAWVELVKGLASPPKIEAHIDPKP